MGIFSCDYGKCQRKPYMEFLDCGENRHTWGYLCFWHYIWARIHRDKHIGFAKVDNLREAIAHLEEEIWDIQEDLISIRDALGIKKETPDVDKMKELWDAERMDWKPETPWDYKSGEKEP